MKNLLNTKVTKYTKEKALKPLCSHLHLHAGASVVSFVVNWFSSSINPKELIRATLIEWKFVICLHFPIQLR